MKASDNGLTLTEILVVVLIASALIGTVITLFTQFRRGFVKGEETNVVLQEGALTIAHMRTDLINAVYPPSLPPDRWAESIRASTDTLEFFLFRDADGGKETVRYSVSQGRLTRTQGSDATRTLINGSLASHSWRVETEEVPGTVPPLRRIWISLALDLGGKTTGGIQAKAIPIRANLFPVRLNRSLYGSR